MGYPQLRLQTYLESVEQDTFLDIRNSQYEIKIFLVTDASTEVEIAISDPNLTLKKYGDVVAYVTSDGKIRVDDLTGGSSLSVSLPSTLQDTNSQLIFGSFCSASSIKREVIAGEDATLLIDGVQITSASNTVDDVIAGITLNLLNENDTTTVTLNVDRDIDSIKSNIEDFVSKYNEAINYIES